MTLCFFEELEGNDFLMTHPENNGERMSFEESV